MDARAGVTNILWTVLKPKLVFKKATQATEQDVLEFLKKMKVERPEAFRYIVEFSQGKNEPLAVYLKKMWPDCFIEKMQRILAENRNNILD